MENNIAINKMNSNDLYVKYFRCFVVLLIFFFVHVEGVYTKTCKVRVTDHQTGKSFVRTEECKSPPRKNNKVKSKVNKKVKKKTVVRMHEKPDDYLSFTNLINRLTLPEKIVQKKRDVRNGPYKSTGIIIGDELNLGNHSYSVAKQTTPRNLIIVAKKIKLDETVEFDLTGRDFNGSARTGYDLNDRSGGDLLLIVDEFDCGINGLVKFKSHGGNGPTKYKVRTKTKYAVSSNAKRKSSRKLKGNNGRLIIASNKIKMDGVVVENMEQFSSQCLSTSKENTEKVEFYNEIKLAIKSIEQKNLAPHGYSPQYHGGKLPVTHWVRYAISKWITFLLDDLVLDIDKATFTEDRKTAVKLLRQSSQLVASDFPVVEGDDEFYKAIMNKLLPLRKRYSKLIWPDQRSINIPDSIPYQALLFTDGKNLETRSAPTDVLIVPRRYNNQSMLGQITFDDKDANLVRLEFDFEFSIDPMINAQIKSTLINENIDYAGLFNDWVLTPVELKSEGIISSSVQLSANNRGGTVSITINAQHLGLILAKLTSRTGIALSFNWHLRNKMDVKGLWSGVHLSFTKQTYSPIKIEPDGYVSNVDLNSVSVEYVQLDNERYQFFSSAIIVPPGKQVKLPIKKVTSTPSVIIPPHAVYRHALDPFKIRSKFKIINGDE